MSSNLTPIELERKQSPFLPILCEEGTVILDGGLATELEARGFVLDAELWSARLLLEDPAAIQQVHADFLEAGADCVVSSTYQATREGFMKRGLSALEADNALKLSVRLALDARERFWANPLKRAGRRRPLVAASVGPYGAYLANGAEYTGAYDASEDVLRSFHAARLHLLLECAPDLIACETIPSFPEARVLRALLAELDDIYVWVSFCCRDDLRLADGTPIADAAKLFSGLDNVAAIGVNCTHPRHLPSLIYEIRKSARKPVLVYPNSGEHYDVEAKRWVGKSLSPEFGELSFEWRRAGASIIGGCCRTRPADIRTLRRVLKGS